MKKKDVNIETCKKVLKINDTEIENNVLSHILG